MKMFSECTDCARCVRHFTVCLAGHGDDDFEPITEEIAKELLEDENFPLNQKLKLELLELFPNLIKIE